MSETETNEQKIPQDVWDEINEFISDKFSQNLDERDDQVTELIVELINDSALKFKHYKQILEAVTYEICQFED